MNVTSIRLKDIKIRRSDFILAIKFRTVPHYVIPLSKPPMTDTVECRQSLPDGVENIRRDSRGISERSGHVGVNENRNIHHAISTYRPKW